MELADLMNTSVLSVTPDTTLAEAAHRMVDHDTGAACVIEDDKLIGVISERDLLRVLAQGFDPDLNVRAGGSCAPAMVTRRSARWCGWSQRWRGSCALGSFRWSTATSGTCRSWTTAA